MPIIAEVRFAHEDGALADTFSSLPDCEIAVIQEASTTPDRSVYVLRFEDVSHEAIREALAADHTVRAVEPMRGFDSQRLVGVEFTASTRLLAPLVTAENGFVVEARSSQSDGTTRMWHERWLLPDGDALHDIWEYAREAGFDFDIIDIREQEPTTGDYGRPTVVSDEQREALLAAYHEGYFAEPRESSLEELATTLDLSATAVAGRLRRGMNALIGTSIGAEERR